MWETLRFNTRPKLRTIFISFTYQTSINKQLDHDEAVLMETSIP